MKDIIEVHAEEMPLEVVPEKPEIEKFEVILNRVVTNEIAKLDKFAEREKELIAKFANVKADSPEGYEKVMDALRELKEIRVGTEKDRKSAKAPFISGGKSIEEKYQWVIGAVEKIEEPLIKERKDFEEKKRQDDIKKQNEKDQRLKTRIDQLKAMGADLDGISVNLGHVSFTTAYLSDTHEEIYISKILPRYQEVFDAQEGIRRANADAQALVKKQERRSYVQFSWDNRRLKLQQASLATERQKQSELTLAEAKKELQARQSAMENIGFAFSQTKKSYSYGEVEVQYSVILEYDQAQWEAFTKEIITIVETETQRIAKEKELEQARINQKKIDDGIAKKKIDDEKIEADRLKGIEESGDKIKHEDTIKYLKATPLYDMRSSQYRTKMKSIRDFLKTIQ